MKHLYKWLVVAIVVAMAFPLTGCPKKDNISALSGATVSTVGVLKAVNLARQYYAKFRGEMVK